MGDFAGAEIQQGYSEGAPVLLGHVTSAAGMFGFPLLVHATCIEVIF